ncbi:LacI family DNA-binding transcriptional regulator, partial [Leuconostoc lactis]
MGYTLKDVAERAGVSLTTVSRVINKRGYFSEQTEARIYAAMQALNYQPNSVARSLSGKKTKLIGVILTNTQNPFNAELLEKIEAELFERSYKVIIANSSDNPEKERAYIGMLQSNQVDGLITASHNM